MTLVLILSVNAVRANSLEVDSEIVLSGAEAKRLYLALKNVPEYPARFYSLTKTVRVLECHSFVQGPLYKKQTICQLDRDWLVDREDISIEGAQELFEALSIEAEVSSGNPPPLFKSAPVSCILRSPTFEAEEENPQNFECKLFFKKPYS